MFINCLQYGSNVNIRSICGMRLRNTSLVMVMVLILCFWATPVLGAVVSQNDVDVVLTTDKTTYQQGENIAATVTVTNKSNLPITDISIEHKNPVGYVFSKESVPSAQFDSLPANETLTLKAVNVPYQVPVTGDDSRIGMWMGLLILAVLGIVFLAIRVKRARRLMALLLCITSVGAYMFSGTAALAENTVRYTDWPEKFSPRMMRLARSAEPGQEENQVITLHVKEQVKVNGVAVEVMATVTFTLPNLSDNLLDDIIDRGDIETLLSMGLISVLFDEQGNIITIDGPFTKKRVRSISEAAELLNSAGSLFSDSFYAEDSDIVYQQHTTPYIQGEGFYRFTPRVGGLPVYGSQVILNTGAAGEVQALYSSYDKRIHSADWTLAITQQQAIDAAKAALLLEQEVKSAVDGILTSNLALARSAVEKTFFDNIDVEAQALMYAADNALPVAAVYAVRLSVKTESELVGSEAEGASDFPYVSKVFFIFANGDQAGSVHSSLSLIETAWSDVYISQYDYNKGVVYSYDAQKNGNKIRLKDKKRDIGTYLAGWGTDFIKGRPYKLPGKLIEYLVGEENIYGLNTHINMAHVYDYYLENMNRKSYDGKGAEVRVSLNFRLLKNFEYDNASWMTKDKQFVAGEVSDYFSAVDVCAHEFTHGVIDFVVEAGFWNRFIGLNGLTYYGESGALNEAYADILGNLIEGKTNDGQWLIGEDMETGARRSMSNPPAYNQPDHYKNWYDDPENKDKGGVHTNSGIFNHAAYQMMTDSRTQGIAKTKWANVFYTSMFSLKNDATFLHARGSIISTAKRFGFTRDQIQAIRDAFDHVGIIEPAIIRMVLTWGNSPADLDAHLVGPGIEKGSRFHVYYAQQDYQLNGQYGDDNVKTAANLNYDDTTSYGPEITTIQRLTPGTYYYYVHDYTNRDTIGSTAMAKSKAVVKIYLGSSQTPLASYTIDPGSKGTFWNVFKLDLEKKPVITPLKTYGDSTTYQ